MALQGEYPVNDSQTTSIAVGAGTVTISVADKKSWFIKEITTTPGANTTVDDVKVDGVSLGITTSPIDTETEFGRLLIARSTISIDVTNGGGAAEDTTLEVKGTEPQ